MSALEEIETRLAAATPGPWEPVAVLVDMSTHEHEYLVATVEHGDEVCSLPWNQREMEGPHGLDEHDAYLIAHAPADLAALVKFARDVQDELNQPHPTTAVIAQVLDVLNGGAS